MASLIFQLVRFHLFLFGNLQKLQVPKLKLYFQERVHDEIFGGYVRYMPIAQEYDLKNKYPSYKNYLFSKYFKHKNYLDAFAAITLRNNNHFEIVREN